MKKIILTIVALIVILGGGLFLINKPNTTKPSTTKESNVIHVVAAENEYGNIAKLIGGNNVQVTSIINNADGDPHTFISSVKNAKLLSDADVIIYNGADYDSWINPILKSNTKATVIKIQDLVNYPETSKFGVNPHLWFDPDTFAALANKLKEVFSEKDSANGSLFEINLESFNNKYKEVYDLVNQIKEASKNTPVTATEPVFGYMTEALGLDMKGLAFQWVIMNDSEPSPQMMIDYQKLLTNKEVKVLFYNKQVTDKVTENILKLAQENDIEIVGVTETMPTDTNAIDWLINTLEETKLALDKVQK